ncbi:MAG: hypothetical protein ACW98D_21220 [Promethearchaeota archaeon]|jgi:hypothetical protein
MDIMKTLFLAFLSTLLIVDVETNEPLVGVEVINKQTGESYYSDIDGKVNIPSDSCNYILNYISYDDTLICGQDTLVKMKQL